MGFLFQLASSLGPALLIPQPWFWQEKLSVGASGGSSALQAWKSMRAWAKQISAGRVFLLNGSRWPCFAQGSFLQKCCFFRKFIPAAQGSPRRMLGFIPNPVGGAGGDSPPVLPRALLVAAIRAGLQNVIRLSGSSWNVPTAAHRTGSCSPNPSFLPPSSQALSAEHELPC